MSVSPMAKRISMGAPREVVSAVAQRYGSAKRAEKGRILDELCATTGWHRKHAVRALRQRKAATRDDTRERRRRYDATSKNALTALWEASDRVCGKRLKVMIPTLLPALERNGRLKLDELDRGRVLAVSAATIDRMLRDVKVAASGGKRRRAGFYSAIRREVPIRTFNDWNSPPPGFCEVDMVAHGGTSVAGSFIQTLTMVDVATAAPMGPTPPPIKVAIQGERFQLFCTTEITTRSPRSPWLGLPSSLAAGATCPAAHRLWRVARARSALGTGEHSDFCRRIDWCDGRVGGHAAAQLCPATVRSRDREQRGHRLHTQHLIVGVHRTGRADFRHPACLGLSLSIGITPFLSSSVIPFFCSTRVASILPPQAHISIAVARSGGQGRRFFSAAEGSSLTDASTAAGCRRSGGWPRDDPRGACHWPRSIASHACIRLNPMGS